MQLTTDGEFSDVATVVADLVATCDVDPRMLLLVGARCRDVLHAAHGNVSQLLRTDDLDIAIAVASVEEYHRVTARLKATGDTGARYRIGHISVDIMSFGDVEDPKGTVTIRPKHGGFSVDGFSAVWRTAATIPIDDSASIRVPSTSGYAVLKAHAYAERIARFEDKDANDIATTLSWYRESNTVHDAVYDSPVGNAALTAYDYDFNAASAYVLGLHMLGQLPQPEQLALREAWNRAPDEPILQRCQARWPTTNLAPSLGALRDALRSGNPVSVLPDQWPL